jgi:acetyl-CoA acyltransferase
MMTKQIQDAYIVAATRTAVGKVRGVFKTTRPDDMLAHVITALVKQVPEIDVSRIDDVIIGCAMPEGAQGMNVARIGLLLANLPNNIPGVTVNRFCSSGLQTIAMAADKIRLGDADVIIAGGTESMTMVPMGGFHYEANPQFFSHPERYESIAYSMGITAEKVAKEWKISREEQDSFALSSHQKALNAIDKHWFEAEISPLKVQTHIPDLQTQERQAIDYIVSTDEGPRRDTSLEALASLRPVFSVNGTVTAGNSSQMSDGAAALLVVSERALKQYQLEPLAKFRGFTVAGVAPEHMGIGPVAAIPPCLQQAGLSIEDIDWIELNEAFAAQSLAVIKTLNLDIAKINPMGGAIALGHPLGATGAIKTTTALYGLQRTKQKYAMVTMCIGTGMGAAGIFERCV